MTWPGLAGPATALALGSLALLALGAVVLEGWTVVRAAGGLLRDGERRVRQLGWAFLATEVWVVALVGLHHAALPMETVLLEVVWLPVMVYALGWMLRDWGLWQVVLRDARGWARVVGLGAVVQLVAAGWLGIAVLRSGAAAPDLAAAGARVSPASWVVLGAVAPLCLALVVGLQLVWLRLTRLRPGPRSPSAPGPWGRAASPWRP